MAHSKTCALIMNLFHCILSFQSSFSVKPEDLRNTTAYVDAFNAYFCLFGNFYSLSQRMYKEYFYRIICETVSLGLSLSISPKLTPFASRPLLLQYKHYGDSVRNKNVSTSTLFLADMFLRLLIAN